jgi:hypothetical protein
LFVTENWGASWTWDTHPLGVWYNPSTGHWNILHEDGTAIPQGATYNVLVTSAFRHTAAPINLGPNYTVLDDAQADNYVRSIWLVTPVHTTACRGRPPWLTCFPSGPFDTSPLAMAYLYEQWTIFNTDNATMSTNTSFDVWNIWTFS